MHSLSAPDSSFQRAEAHRVRSVARVPALTPPQGHVPRGGLASVRRNRGVPAPRVAIPPTPRRRIRFAEPRLRRASPVGVDPDTDALLRRVRSALSVAGGRGTATAAARA